MNILKILFDLCLFQAKPQDIPFSQNILLLTALSLAVGIFLTLPPEEVGINAVLTATVHVLAYGFAIWGALKLQNKSERYIQTMTALFGTATIFQFITWPVAQWLFQVRGTPEEQIPLLLVLILGIWTFIVAIVINKHAMEIKIGISIVITLACQMFAASMVLILFGKIMI